MSKLLDMRVRSAAPWPRPASLASSPIFTPPTPPPTTSHSSQAPAMRNTLLSLEHAILFHVSVPCICFPFSHHPENSCFAFKAQLHVGYCKSSPVHPKLQVSPAFQKFAFHHFVYRRPTLVPVFANQEESEGDFHFYKTRQKAKTTFSV